MVELYDGDMTFLGPAGHALRHGYELKLNEMAQATLELPVADACNGSIVPGVTFARYYDGAEFVHTFRVTDVTYNHEAAGTASYVLDGAECTLLDDMLAGWHEIGGTGYSTEEVMEYILARQTTPRWRVGRCDFREYYQYNFEDVTLLEALMSLGEVLTDPYRIEFDTTNEPWTVNLVRLSDTPAASLVYRRNMTRLKRKVTGTVVTRLYGRGYGEGDNQLTIAGVNDGLDYLDAPQEAMDLYGVRQGVHVDTRQTDPETLRAQMQRILDAGCHPQISYEATALDLTRADGYAEDAIAVGDAVRVLDETMDGPVVCRVTELEKQDVDGDPGGLRIVLDTGGGDTAEQLNEVLEKIGVQQLYSQGATSMYAVRGAENADAGHPMELDFYIPGNVLRINSCLLKWKKQPYRVDFSMAASGGGSTATSDAGGGISTTLPGQSISQEFVTTDATNADGTAISLSTAVADGSIGNHRHNIPEHHHDLWLLYQLPAQQLNLDPHSHTVTLPAHTHPLTYGITTGGGTADSVTIVVDGQEIPSSENEIEIAQYLTADDDGRIRRGAWHTVTIRPDGNARIIANLFIQQFLQSRGGGDY